MWRLSVWRWRNLHTSSDQTSDSFRSLMHLNDLPARHLLRITSFLPTSSLLSLAVSSHALSQPALTVLHSRLPTAQPQSQLLALPVELLLIAIAHVETPLLPVLALSCRTLSSIVRPILTTRIRAHAESIHSSSSNNNSKHAGTPLHTAAWLGDYRLARLCLATGLSPDSVTKLESTPLHYACMRTLPSIPAIVTLLLSAGASPTVMNYNLLTPLHYSATTGQLSTFSQLLAAVPIEKVPSDLLLPAAEHDHPAIIRAVDAVIPASVRNIPQNQMPHRDPLLVAAAHGKISALAALLETRPSVVPTALLAAAAGTGQTTTVEYLLSIGATPDTRALRKAALAGHVETVGCLLRAGADRENRNVYGMTVLDSVVRHLEQMGRKASVRVMAVRVLLESKGGVEVGKESDLVRKVEREWGVRERLRMEKEAEVIERFRIFRLIGEGRGGRKRGKR